MEQIKHKIPLELTDKEYKRYFLKWLKLQSSLGIINQVALFANCLNGLTADVRISMLAECFEAFGKRLEKEKKIIVKSENNTTRTVQCENCKEKFELPIRGKKSFACYMTALIETYGKTIFSREYRRRKTLIQKIVKTRNKVFHVNAKQNGVLGGAQCGFYAIKLEWMFRYIIWLEMGFPKDMLVSVPPYLSIAQFMGFLKGKSSLMIFDRHANLKYKYGQRSFWCRGYFVDTVGKNETAIRNYIRNQLEEDYAKDQISLKEYTDPFTGSKNKKA